MNFREWFERQQAADLLCWADEEAAATGWNAALEAAETAIVSADGCGEPLVLALASVRALKEQA